MKLIYLATLLAGTSTAFIAAESSPRNDNPLIQRAVSLSSLPVKSAS